MYVPKFIDLTDMRFGRLTVESRAPNQYTSGNHLRVMWNCICDCGNRIVADGQALRNGATVSCGCLHSEVSRRIKPDKRLDLTGQTFGYLTVLERDEDKVSASGKRRTVWKCVCKCGNKLSVTTDALRSGRTKSCGCYCKERASESSIKNYVGERFGLLTVVKRGPNVRLDQRTTLVTWICRCDCGNVVTVRANNLRSGNTQSCGCMGASAAEYEVLSYLKQHGIKFKYEYGNDELITSNGGHARFDFAILNFRNEIVCLIECQGLQHYEPRKNSDFGEFQREETDSLKRSYCETHGIPLREIRYDEDTIEKLITILTEFKIMHANPVPSPDETGKV